MEARICSRLGYFLNVWSFHDMALFKLHETCQIKDEETVKEIEELCNLIGKFVIFNYELYGHYNVEVMGQALLNAALRVHGNERLKGTTGFDSCDR